MRSDNTIADLHYTAQLAMGWSNFHLHRFRIRGRDYGVSRLYLYFDEPGGQVRLGRFKFRLRERFLYEYDFGDLWQHEIRLEKMLPVEKDKTYPRCIGGGWAAPPEDCGGPWAYMQLRDHYSIWYIADQLQEVIEYDEVQDRMEDIRRFQYWLSVREFDRRRVNRRLKSYAQGDDDWQQALEVI